MTALALSLIELRQKEHERLCKAAAAENDYLRAVNHDSVVVGLMIAAKILREELETEAKK